MRDAVLPDGISNLLSSREGGKEDLNFTKVPEMA